MKQAIRPSFFNLPISKKDKEAEAKGITDEEIALSTLSESGGWKVLSGFIQGLLSDLENVNTIAIAQGQTFEEIGRNTVVVNMAKEVINRIITKVQDAHDACEQK